MSHYADASLPQQLDAFVWFDGSSAVTLLGPQHAKAGAPDTYAFGSSLHRRHQLIRSTWDGWWPGSEPGTRDPSRGFENARLPDLRVPQHGRKRVDGQLCNSAVGSPCLPGSEPEPLTT